MIYTCWSSIAVSLVVLSWIRSWLYEGKTSLSAKSKSYSCFQVVYWIPFFVTSEVVLLIQSITRKPWKEITNSLKAGLRVYHSARHSLVNVLNNCNDLSWYAIVFKQLRQFFFCPHCQMPPHMNTKSYLQNSLLIFILKWWQQLQEN